jgi:hypothetical protein
MEITTLLSLLICKKRNKKRNFCKNSIFLPLLISLDLKEEVGEFSFICKNITHLMSYMLLLSNLRSSVFLAYRFILFCLRFLANFPRIFYLPYKKLPLIFYYFWLIITLFNLGFTHLFCFIYYKLMFSKLWIFPFIIYHTCLVLLSFQPKILFIYKFFFFFVGVYS